MNNFLLASGNTTVTPELANTLTNIMAGVVLSFAFLILFALPYSEHRSAKRRKLTLRQLNERYLVNITPDQSHVLFKLLGGKGKFVFSMKPILGPREDSTIDLEVDGTTKIVSLELNGKDNILISEGKELPRKGLIST